MLTPRQLRRTKFVLVFAVCALAFQFAISGILSADVTEEWIMTDEDGNPYEVQPDSYDDEG